MAKAADPSSTTVWIWLHEALALAVEALGSVALAKAQLTEWMAAGKLPWSCTSWKGLDQEDLTKRRREKERLWKKKRILLALPKAAYYPGDPRFWSARGLWIDWEDNVARELARDGAQALGIRVSRSHLLALLHEGPGEREEARGAAPLVGGNKAAPTKRKAKAQPDQDRARWAILQLYPKDSYPSGVPDTVSPGTLHRAVADKLAEHEPAKLKLPVPSVRTVQRARRRL